ncbi:MAG: C1 family peptidase [Chloroflexota bacterium]|nr:C1 family peptidase [Chloroflexota bacterium]
MGNVKRLLLIVFLATVSALVSPGVVAGDPPVEGGLGLVRSKGDFPRMDASRLAVAGEDLPPKVDLSAGLPPAGSQGGQASCVGWALGYYYKTFQEHEERGWDISSPEHQFSPAWVYNQRNTSQCEQDAGMSYYDGLQILQKGAGTLASFPYDPRDTCTRPSSALQREAQIYRIDDFQNVFAGSEIVNINLLKSLLADGQPFAIGVPVYTSFYDVTHSDPLVPRHQPGERLCGGHAMLVVGYDDAIGGFKTINSWGADWGRDGYCYLSYDFVKHDAWEGWVMHDHVAPVASFLGAVTVDGKAAQGVEVTALIDDTPYATTATEFRDGAARYSVRIGMDDPNTCEKEGGSDGDVVSFKVGATFAEETGVWQGGRTIPLDLSVSTGAEANQEKEYVFLPAIFF